MLTTKMTTKQFHKLGMEKTVWQDKGVQFLARFQLRVIKALYPTTVNNN